MTSVSLPVAHIRVDAGIQQRVQLNMFAVEDYAEAMRAGATFPPVVVFSDGQDYWLADGFHRLAAAERAELETVAVDLRSGTRRDAILYAVGANADHGIRRTNADKRRAVLTLLEDDEWSKWESPRIAHACSVTVRFVNGIRAELGTRSPFSPTRRMELIRSESSSGMVPSLDTTHINAGDWADDEEEEDWDRPLPPHEWASTDDLIEAGMAALEAEYQAELATYEGREPEQESDTTEEPENDHKLAVHFSSASPEWYTPRHVVERVIAALGAIDLDPCSNSKTTPNVPAKHHLTVEDDGLSLPWFGRIYMNPPYGDAIRHWVEKLSSEYEQGRVSEAVALVPARTDTAWFRRLPTRHLCFINGRLTFSEHESPAPFPSAAIYLGSDPDAFIQAFRDIGCLYERIETRSATEAA